MEELAAIASLVKLGASLFLSGRAVSDMVCAGAKRPKPRRREADLLMDSFADGLSGGRPRGRGQRRQPKGKSVYAAVHHIAKDMPHLFFRFNLSFLSVVILQQPICRKSMLKISTKGESAQM